jgi:very-short-patch-repair endonuclease
MPERVIHVIKPYNRELTPAAKVLRKHMTPQERRLWYGFLRNHPIKFYRQRVIRSFIADFYCSKAKLVIELDGSQHYTDDGLAYDKERSAILNGLGLRVLRFSNTDVDNNFACVCSVIDGIVNS